jgi:Ser-tRNA(Ala) deacylase AlaX
MTRRIKTAMFDHDAGKVIKGTRILYNSDAEDDDQTLYTPEEEQRLQIYGSALDELVSEDARYTSNYNLWQRWDNRLRLWWIRQIEKQAQAGQHTIGVDVVTRAAIIRLGG